MAKIVVNGTQYYYELSGQGPALILISGYTCEHTFWSPIIKELDREFQVLTFDNRGVGQTKDSQEPLTAESMSSDVMALAEALKLTQPHIVGHSMGGTIAQCIAARFTNNIGKLGILSSTAKWRQVLISSTKSLLDMRKQNCSFDLIVSATIPWIFGEAFLKDPKAIEDLKRMAIANPYPQSIEDQERQHQVLVKFEGKIQLKDIHSPTLIIYGRQDLAALPDEAIALASSISGSQLVGLDCGHGMVAELPEESVSVLIKFLKST